MEKQGYLGDNLIVNLTFDFALDIIDYSERLSELKKFVIQNQLLKSGTAIGALVCEAQNAESKADFIHKFKIAAKEAEETEYWLLLCNHSKHYPSTIHLINKLPDIKRIINKIISSSKRNNRPIIFILAAVVIQLLSTYNSFANCQIC